MAGEAIELCIEASASHTMHATREQARAELAAFRELLAAALTLATNANAYAGNPVLLAKMREQAKATLQAIAKLEQA